MFRFISLAALVAAAAALTIVATAGAMSHPKLVGTVGKNGAYKITLKDSHGKSWTFTSVSFVGTKTRTLKLVPGKYKAYCAPHESIMFQHFSVK